MGAPLGMQAATAERLPQTGRLAPSLHCVHDAECGAVCATCAAHCEEHNRGKWALPAAVDSRGVI